MKRRWRLKISFLHTGQRDSRRLHLRHMQACPQGISATCTSRTMHTLQSRPGTPGGPSPFAYRLRLPVPSCFSGMSTIVSGSSPANSSTAQHTSDMEGTGAWLECILENLHLHCSRQSLMQGYAAS